ncbi:hypothetical protein M3Y99_00447400 [Aphelenchoides fujianensis]|nr:hypothetical protein M3Y99_00447400 [Aphelenchoides fujianensis]
MIEIGGLEPCTKQEDCTRFDLSCEETLDGKGRFCCGKKEASTSTAPPTTTSSKPEPPIDEKGAVCPDGVAGGIEPCAKNEDCGRFELTCEETLDGKGKRCCGKKEASTAPPTTTSTAPAPPTTTTEKPTEEKGERCPDGVRGGLTPCTKPEDCTRFDLSCEETLDGKGKFCCGKKEQKTTTPAPTSTTTAIPVVTTAGPAQSTTTEKPVDQKGERCPDGVAAGIEKCTTNEQCTKFDLTCEETLDGKGRYCCGKKEATTTSAPTTAATTTSKPDVDAQCPDGVNVVAECKTDLQCARFELKCTETPGGTFCCGPPPTTTQPTPTTSSPEKKAAVCPDGVAAGLQPCKTNLECGKFDLSCEDTPDGKFCCGKAPSTSAAPTTTTIAAVPSTTPAPAPPTTTPKTAATTTNPEDDKAATCPDGVSGGLQPCKTNLECAKFDLTCEETIDGKGRHCCGKAATTATEKPPTQPPKPDTHCKKQIHCDRFDLVCTEVAPGRSYCCGPPATTTAAATTTTEPPGPDDKCPDGETAIPDCKTQIDCDRFDLVCTTVDSGRKYCSQKCADGVDAFIKCDQSTRMCTADTSLLCERIKGTYYCSTCQDVPSDCPKAAAMCSNPQYATIMRSECPATCADWVSHGFCSHPFFSARIRARFCAQSCDECAVFSQVTPVRPSDPDF